MKKLIQLLVFAALVATLAIPALAQTTAANKSVAAASSQDGPEVKAAAYKQFTDNIKTNPAVAYEAGKAYLAKYESTDGAEDQYVKYIKRWVTNYEKLARREQLFEQLKNKQNDQAFASAKQVLTDFPDDLGVMFELAKAGTIAATGGNESLNPDTINYTKRTIQLIQSGKSFDPNKPFTEKEKSEMLGNLNYALGLLLQKTSPSEAVTYFINAAQVDGPAKNNPITYYKLAEIYETTDYGKLATQFNDSCKTEEQAQTQQCKDLKTKADQVVDHIIDALARAITYSNSSPDAASFAQARTAWTESMTKYYKYRNNNSDTGLKELLSSITTRPLPKPGEAVTPSLYPASAPTTGTTTPPSSSTGAVPASTTGATTKVGASSTTTTTTGQPASKSTTSKTTPKRAH